MTFARSALNRRRGACAGASPAAPHRRRATASATEEWLCGLQIYPTKDYPSFEDALDALYSEEVVRAHPPRSAALACAGPVIDNRCQMTNLSWLIDGHELTARRNIL